MQKKNKIIFGSLGLLVFFNVVAWMFIFYSSYSQLLEVTFFDVGQGDSVFIEAPQSYQILIDGGPSSVVLEKLAQEMPFWDRTIDLVVLTHPEHDHLAGLLDVLKRYKVENILWTGIERDTAESIEWQRLIQEEGAEIIIAQSGQKIRWSRNAPGYLEVLYPFDNLEGKRFKNSNNTSVIAKLVFGQNSFLLTGDSEKSSEKVILEMGIDIDSDVLKVGHHGSKTSSSDEFVTGVSPEIAVISAGKDNQYGHPHLETLATLEKYVTNIFRTDEEGDVKLVSNGKTINFKQK